MSNKALAILIHGFNVWDGGRATVGRLRPFLSANGIPSLSINYGYVGLIGTRLRNGKIAERVARATRVAVDGGFRPVVIGHSNGCAIAHLAMQQVWSECSASVIYINPALTSDAELAPAVSQLAVWHSPSDKPVRWSKWLPTSDARPWGEMGAVGYTGDDTRVTNYNKELMEPPSTGHSDLFSDELLPFYGPLLAAGVVMGGRQGAQVVW